MAIEVTKYAKKTVFVVGEKERKAAGRWMAKREAQRAQVQKQVQQAKLEAQPFNNPFFSLR